MQHARPDYNRIQDPAGKIPSDEPVFLLRGQDVSAPAALEAWAQENSLNKGDAAMSQLALEQAERMRAWQRDHVVKVADL